MTPTVTIIAKTGCKLCTSLREKLQLLNMPCYYVSYVSSVMALPDEILFFTPENNFQPIPMTWREAPVTDALAILVMASNVDIDKLPTPTAIFQGQVYDYAHVVRAVREYQKTTPSMRQVS